MTEQVIPAEAVEAAAKLCLERADGYKWAEFPEEDRAGIREFVRPILEAAAPYMPLRLAQHTHAGGRSDGS